MIEDIALMRVLPNMTVLAPSDAIQTGKIVELMAENYGPMYARVGRANVPIIYEKEYMENMISLESNKNLTLSTLESKIINIAKIEHSARKEKISTTQWIKEAEIVLGKKPIIYNTIVNFLFMKGKV